LGKSIDRARQLAQEYRKNHGGASEHLVVVASYQKRLACWRQEVPAAQTFQVKELVGQTQQLQDAVGEHSWLVCDFLVSGSIHHDALFQQLWQNHGRLIVITDKTVQLPHVDHVYALKSCTHSVVQEAAQSCPVQWQQVQPILQNCQEHQYVTLNPALALCGFSPFRTDEAGDGVEHKAAASAPMNTEASEKPGPGAAALPAPASSPVAQQTPEPAGDAHGSDQLAFRLDFVEGTVEPRKVADEFLRAFNTADLKALRMPKQDHLHWHRGQGGKPDRALTVVYEMAAPVYHLWVCHVTTRMKIFKGVGAIRSGQIQI